MELTKRSDQNALKTRIRNAESILFGNTAYGGWQACIYQDAAGYFSVLEDTNDDRIWSSDKTDASIDSMLQECGDLYGVEITQYLCNVLDESDN
jgi:hypothetical protein